MGTKISDLPVTGSLPADAVFPLEYGGANYSVKASDLGTGGSTEVAYIDQTEIYDKMLASGTVTNDWEVIDIPSTIPSTASGIIVTAYGSTDGGSGTSGNVKVYLRSSKITERLASHTYADNSYGSGSTHNTFIIPYTSTIDLKSVIIGAGSGSFAKFYVEGYIAGGGSSSSGTTSAILPFAHARIFTNNAGTGIGMSWGAYNNGYVEVTFDTAQPDTDYYVVTDRETYDQHLIDIDQKTTSGFRTKWVNSDNSLLPPGTFGGMLTVYGSTPTIDIGGGSSSSSSSGPGLGIEFFDTVEILADDLSGGNWSNATGAWVTVPSDPAWAGAENIIISMGLYDGDTAGNTGQAFEVRANSNSTSVEVLRHHGTSNDRSATAVQAIIPIDSDGTWQYRHVVLYGSYARINYLRASGKILPIPSDNSWSSGWEQSHGGVAVANGSTHTITHNLGTTDVIVKAYVNTSAASDSGAQEITSGGGVTSTFTWEYGAQVKDLSSNSLTLQLSSDGALLFDSSGETSAVTSFANCYIKVVVLAAGTASGGGSGPRAYVAFDGTSADLTASITKSFNVDSITDNGVGFYRVNLTNAVTDAVTVASSKRLGSSISSINTVVVHPEVENQTEIRIYCHAVDSNGNLGSYVDPPVVNLVVF
jgi:hypothetical protein